MRISTIVGALAMSMLLSGAVQAAPDPDMELLAAVTEPGTSMEAVEALTLAKLDEIRGEGTWEQFFELPKLRRSFERHFQFEYEGQPVDVWVTAVAGVGVTIKIDSPLIP